jgi:hypothetical protein
MNTLEITQCLKKDPYAKTIFKQVVPRDKLPNVPRLGYPSAFVINTQPSYMRGEHWLAVYYDKQGFCTFFDSYGMKPSFYNLHNFVFQSSRGFEHNTQQLQSLTSSVCGNYCIYFIMLKARGLKLHEILELFDKKDFCMNDSKMKCLID